MMAPYSILVAAVLAALSGVTRADDWNDRHSSIRSAGDTDQDGTPDLLIAGDGVVFLVSGKTRALLLTLPTPATTAKGFASSMDTLGDVNSDGHSDFVVAWQTPEVANIHSGLDGRILFTIRSAWRVAAGGDVNNDGVADLLVGSRGRVRLCSGRDGSLLTEVLSGAADEGVEPSGFETENRFGESIVGVGDVDGDSFGDFIVGSPGIEPSRGAIELFSGKSGRSIKRITEESAFRNLGWSLVAVGDVDGDGSCDVIVGALHRYSAAFSGRDLKRIYTVESRNGKRVMDAFASNLDRLGDVDGDGIADWIVGANETADGMFDEGYAQVHSGADGELLRVEFESKKFGVDVCGLGDVDGDKVPDAAVACPAESWVRVLSGKDGKLIHQIDVARLRESTTKPR